MAVRTSLSLTDRMTNTLQQIMKAMNSTMRTMEQLHTTSDRSMDMRSLQRARRDIENAQSALARLQESARQAGNNGQDAGNRIRNSFQGASEGAETATSRVRQLLSSLTNLAVTYLSIQALANGFSKFTQASDNYSNTNARLTNVNDGLQTQVELQDKVYRAAQRSLTSYNDTAASVAKLNLLAKDSFKSNDEAIRFAELMNKSFSVSGASTQEKQAGMYQLTQAMAAGKLQGDEFRSIMENAPMLAQAIADATGNSMGDLKKMSAEGTITADIIKKALFGAATDIEEKFANMPLTFADAMTVFKNWAQRAFEPLFVRFSQFINSDAFGVLAGHAMVFVNLFVSGLSFVFDMLEALYNAIGAVGQFMQQNASWVVPILVVLGTVIGSIVAILMVKYAVLGLIRIATLAWAAAMWVVNSAFLASPITWILIAIIAIIALVVMAFIMWAEQTAVVIGAIVGYVFLLGASYYNVLIGIANLAITVAEWFVNNWNQAIYLTQLAWIAFNLLVRMVLDAIVNSAITNAERIANTFNDATYGVQMAFYTMGTMVLKTVGGVADGTANIINKALGGISDLINGAVRGVNSFIGLLNGVLDTDLSTIGTVDFKIGSGATNFADSFQKILEAPQRAEKITLQRLNTAQDYMDSVTMPTAPTQQKFARFDYKDLGAAYDKGNAIGQKFSMGMSEKLSGLVDKAKGLAGLGKEDKNKENPFLDKGSLLDNVVNTAPSETGLGAASDKDKKLKGGKLDKVDKIGEVNLADEYLEIFKDIAEGRAINNIVSLTPNLQVQNTFEDTAGSVLSKVLNKIGDLSNVGGYAAKLNNLVSQALNVPTKDNVNVSKEVRENVAASPITNNSKTVVQHIQSEPRIEFSGDINKDVDLEELIRKIVKWLKDEQDRSTEGVYE
ncbi:tape measure protein [Lysinibacillus piscis]|uniref:Tail length tape measure protein n=1 Tax=Lysinibacillus piscis TaxID=2518931 RepID=A0ABQ5NHB3_9BACI|nr:tape measure protein [Lysinibacillus sp. KH24]GLC87487.1 tail length tape measure protein [Lysinibacillus sp. KH24]